MGTALMGQVESLTTKTHDVETQLASSTTLAEQLQVQLLVAEKANDKLEAEKSVLSEDYRNCREIIDGHRNEIQSISTVNAEMKSNIVQLKLTIKSLESQVVNLKSKSS